MRLIFKHQSKIIFLVIVSMFLTTSYVSAQEGTQLYLEASEAAAGTLTVDIIAKDVADLYGAEVKLHFDPTLLAVQDDDADRDGVQITGGKFLPAEQGFIVANQVDAEAGTITYAITLLNPAPPVNGTGTIATVTFDKLQDGPATIEFEKAKLVASTLQAIPNETLPLEIGTESQPEVKASTEITTQPPVIIKTAASNVDETTFSPWLVAGGAVILAIIGLGLLFLLGSVILFGRRPHIATKKSIKNKLSPAIRLHPVANIRIQRPHLRPSRRGITTRPE
ncbi:MAG: hypothetical protein KDJ52_03245 [Anaerolineae bacterium]|nr:hypothetical protein [Anaerolineae bacterium]